MKPSLSASPSHINICTHSPPALYMTHMKHFASSEKQLLVNKAAYWDSSAWVAAMFSIFGVCVCVWSWSSVSCWGLGCECFLNASESPSSREITAPWSHLFSLSSGLLLCTLMDEAPLRSLIPPRRLVWSSPRWEGQADLSCFWFNSCKMQDILSPLRAQPDFFFFNLHYKSFLVSGMAMCPHLHV